MRTSRHAPSAGKKNKNRAKPVRNIKSAMKIQNRMEFKNMNLVNSVSC